MWRKLNGSEKKEFIAMQYHTFASLCLVTLCADKYEHLVNLDLADSSDSNDQMSIDTQILHRNRIMHHSTIDIM